MATLSPEALKKYNDELKRQIELMNEINTQEKSLLNTIENKIFNEEKYNEILNKIEATKAAIKGSSDEDKKILLDKLKILNSQAQKEKEIANSRKESLKYIAEINDKPFFKSLMEGDRVIKQTNLQLGLTNKQVFSAGMGANTLSQNFQGAAMYAARLGMSLADVAKIQMAYSNENGRSLSLSSDMLKNIALIGAGTGMGAEASGKMAANFDLIGVNAASTKEFVEETVNKSQQMGLNAGKVFTTLNSNFLKLQQYTFKNSVNGLRDMVMYSQKFGISLEEAMASANKARKLDDVIEMGANLQVLGGQFAKLGDPMAMLYESRNNLEAYNQRIGDMTNGLIAMRKTADGFSFELASPADRDRMDQAAKAMGKTTEALMQQALQSKKILETRKAMSSLTVTKDQKELIEGLANLDSKSGKMTVNIGKDVVEVSNLTKNQIESLKIQKQTLEERAKNSQTFDEAYKNTIAEFKTILLPMLNGINSVLQEVRPFFEGITNFFSNNPTLTAFLGWGGAIVGSAAILGKTFKAVWDTAGRWENVIGKTKAFTPSGDSVFGRAMGGVSNASGGATSPSNPFFTKAGTIRKGAPELINAQGGLAKAQGMKNLATGAGVGAAGLGIGAGVGLAAVGVSKLADAMKGMTKEQADALVSITWSLTAMAAVGAAAGVAIGFIGASATVAAPGLGALALSVLGIGAGIGLAAAGIGYMATGLSSLVVSGKDAGDSLMTTALGVGALMGAMTLGGAGALFGGVGLALFAAQMETISSYAEPMKIVGDAFGNIATVMKGTKEDFQQVENTVKAISSMDSGKATIFNELVTLLKSPLKVEFADKNVAMVANITLNIDGKKLMDNLSLKEHITLKTINASRGTGN